MQEGKLVTDEMIRLGTIESRLHRCLVEGEHNVPWPDCLELKWEKDVFSDKTTKRVRLSVEDLRGKGMLLLLSL